MKAEDAGLKVSCRFPALAVETGETMVSADQLVQEAQKQNMALETERRNVTWASREETRILGALTVLVLLALSTASCQKQKVEPVTITFMDPEWSHDTSGRSIIAERNLQEFTKETGIRVEHVPAPETSLQQLALSRELLHGGGSNPDVYGIDIVWAPLLDQDLLDLKPYFANQLASMDSNLVAAYTVNGRVVAIPYHTNVGVLLYRRDLLEKYGYAIPPRNWSELEQMALRIQTSERKAGVKDFWGFVWSGASGESLTCQGLEWQLSDGGGQIIEPGGRISVNNPNAIRAWQRAQHWIGWISPPSVTSYEEWDAINNFEHYAKAAFRRSWTSDYFLSQPSQTPLAGKIGITTLPAGTKGEVAVLGGFGLGVSRASAHQTEAAALIRFLLRKEEDLELQRRQAGTPTYMKVYRLPAVLKAYARPELGTLDKESTVVSRPSSAIGTEYEKVSRAYAEALHSVLTGEVPAPKAAVRLDAQLLRIVGSQKNASSRQPAVSRIQ